MRQEEFNRLVFQVVVALALSYVGLSYWRWYCAEQKRRGSHASSGASLPGLPWPPFRTNSAAVPDEPPAGKEGKQPLKGERPRRGAAKHRGAQGRRGEAVFRSRTDGTSAAQAAFELLEALSSGSSGPPSDLDVQEKAAGSGASFDVIASPTGSGTGNQRLFGKHVNVCVMQDVRPGKSPDTAVQCLAELSLAELGVNVWDIVSKRKRLRVTGCVSMSGVRYKALGLVLYRQLQHTLQAVYLIVATTSRRQGIGRSLVRSLREHAKREPLCLNIMALLPQAVAGQANGEESVPFWRAVGFRRADARTGGQLCMQLEVRKLGKQMRRQLERQGIGPGTGGNLLLWPELLAETLSEGGNAARQLKATWLHGAESSQKGLRKRSKKRGEREAPVAAQEECADADLDGAVPTADAEGAEAEASEVDKQELPGDDDDDEDEDEAKRGQEEDEPRGQEENNEEEDEEEEEEEEEDDEKEEEEDGEDDEDDAEGGLSQQLQTMEANMLSMRHDLVVLQESLAWMEDTKDMVASPTVRPLARWSHTSRSSAPVGSSRPAAGNEEPPVEDGQRRYGRSKGGWRSKVGEAVAPAAPALAATHFGAARGPIGQPMSGGSGWKPSLRRAQTPQDVMPVWRR